MEIPQLPFSTAPTKSSLYKLPSSQSYVTTDGQSASLSWCQAPIWGLRPDFYYCQTDAGLLMWDAFSGERTGLPFTIAAGPRQGSHSWVRVLQDSWPYFTASDTRLPQPGGSGPHIYIPQEQGGPVIPPSTGFPFHHLLMLARLRWRYSNLPPCRAQSQSYVTTDGQLTSLSWNKAPIWGLQPDLYYCMTFAGLLKWGALSDKRTSLSFTNSLITD
jgi:hypothetical protein